MNTREQETREAGKRIENWRQPSALPEVPDHPDYDHRWLRESCYGVRDNANINSRQREGYAFVSPSEAGIDMSINEGGKERVGQGGLLLSRIPKKFAKQRNDFYAARSRGQEQAVDQNLMKVDSAALPIFANRKSEVTQSSPQGVK